MLTVGVLGSTNGTSFQPILDAIYDGRLPHVRIGAVISNVERAGILQKAHTADVPNYFIAHENKTRKAFEQELIAKLQLHGVDIILLIGYMRVLSPVFLAAFPGRVVNIHPSLLPSHAGGMDLNVHQAVIDAKDTVSGCTLHLVDEGVDTGKILVQKECNVEEGETSQTLKQKVQQLEGEAFVELLSEPETYLDLGPLRMVKRALLSVSNKDGIVPFAKKLAAAGVELVSTGGTAHALKEAGLTVIDAATFTGYPEMMQGRVKTLHPAIHGAILGRRDSHADEATTHGIQWIDLVVCNLYPFADVIAKPETDKATAIENIDIGGPSMIRSAAKNVDWVSVVVNPSDYETVAAEIAGRGGITAKTRSTLQAKAFAHTAWYDATISQYFSSSEASTYPIPTTLVDTLRYGENPHQDAQVFRLDGQSPSLADVIIHQGKKLSYNNYLDVDAAIRIVRSFSDATAVVVKHANPCGVASHPDIEEAFQRAYASDSRSAFGGIVSLNRECTSPIATAITSVFAEVVIAPSYTTEARTILAKKKNLRVIEFPPIASLDKRRKEFRSLLGAMLVQDAEVKGVTQDDLTVATRRSPSQRETEDLLFAWRVISHAKSNAILIAKNQATVGLGAGQVSRVDATYLAIRKAQLSLTSFDAAIAFDLQLDGCVLASDAFFPFRDNIDAIAKAGIRAIIQPGGSMRDSEVIQACDEYDISMVFTGSRCFRH